MDHLSPARTDPDEWPVFMDHLSLPRVGSNDWPWLSRGRQDQPGIGSWTLRLAFGTYRIEADCGTARVSYQATGDRVRVVGHFELYRFAEPSNGATGALVLSNRDCRRAIRSVKSFVEQDARRIGRRIARKATPT